MEVPSPETTKWLGLLAAALALTTFGTTFPNRLNQSRSARAHNGVRLFNECLARCQLALFNFFLALAISAELGTHARAKFLLIPLIVTATYSYVSCVAASIDLDKRLVQTHECTATATSVVDGTVTTSTSTACKKSIGPWEFSKLSFRYVFWAAIFIVIAVRYAYLAGS
jgi:hypothetical protein